MDVMPRLGQPANEISSVTFGAALTGSDIRTNNGDLEPAALHQKP
jgi:hypothetical protein